MHILLIHQAFAALSEPGGTRHYEIAVHLVESGHRVTVIASPVSYLTGSSSASKKIAEQDELVIHRAYTYTALHKSFIHRVLSFFSFMVSSFIIGLRVGEVDLVWGTSPPIFQGVTAWLLARLKRVPFLFEVRDLWPAFAIAVGVLQNNIIIKASEWLERFLYHRADQMLVNSPGFIQHIEERGGDEIVLVPNGADPRMFVPMLDGNQFKKSHQLEDKFVALYAGAHGMSNDLEILLEAAEKLLDQSEIAIVLLGDGKEKRTLLGKARRLGLHNAIFIPSIPKTQMGEALAAADACVAILKPVELYKTVYPNKVFDYMAAGRPVILAIDGVIRDVVEAADAGIFVPPGDADSLAAAIRDLAANRQEADRLGKNGRKLVEEHFDRRELSKKMAQIMKDLIEK